jgi:hypothetical protein
VYDTATDTWTQVADMPVLGANLASCVLDGRIYAILGDSPILEVYDPTTNEWQRGPDFPSPRHVHTVVSVGGKVYVLGGGLQGLAMGGVWEYDPAR